MKRLILHIGTHKTGTTSLQSFLKANADLLEANGLFFPLYPKARSSAPVSRNAHFLHCQALGRVRGKRVKGDENGGSDWIKERFRAQLDEHDTILLSDEHLWFSLTTVDGYLDHLCDVIDECGVDQTDIVVYLRRQDGYAESYWKQWVKSDMRTVESFSEHLEKRHASIYKYLDYSTGISRIEEKFGRNHVIVRKYQRDTLAKGDVRWDFADVLGFEITDDFVFPEEAAKNRAERGNVSLSNNLTEILRTANLSPTYRKEFYPEFRAAARTATVTSREDPGKASVMTPAQREDLLAQFAEGNARIAREYFGLEDGVLFDPPNPEAAIWSPDAISLQHDTILFFTEVIARMATRIDDLEQQVEELKHPSDKKSRRDS